jgi:hypothetical protein
MDSGVPIRLRLLAAFLLVAGSASAQLPAPTVSLPTKHSASEQIQPTASLLANEGVESRLEVRYAKGRLEIDANDSSLNQILNEIARQTGMKITGVVADERVFGRYGPGAPAEILASLLDGTGSNMLLKETATAAPAELILTPRIGGRTPPNPNEQGSYDDRSSGGSQSMAPALRPFQNPHPMPIAPPVSIPQTIQDAPSADSTTQPAAPPAVAQPSGGDPQSPNGVKTPQQIYEQLQLLRQQQQQQQQASPQ